jgi:FlaG/FlaF family flagellin (archaellin)
MGKFIQEDGVSPVIGILLMLVVTIIIAAVVSGFAGGLAGGTDKVPKASISGAYSQSGYMSMSHNGGDSLATRNTRVTVRLSNELEMWIS